MKKYKTTSSKKHTQFADRVTDDSVTMMDQESILDESVDQEPLIPLSQSEQDFNQEPIQVEASDPINISESIIDNPIEPELEPVLLKPKHRIWPLIHSKKSPETVNFSAKVDEIIVPEQKEEIMKNETFESTASVKNPSAVISEMMTISGNVEMATPLLLAGKVIGNIDCKDNIEVRQSGSVQGNIKVHSIKLTGGEINGNIVCEGTLETDEETVITGDISAEIVILCGKVTGQVKANESVSLSSTAVIKGDLYSASISVEKGAVLDGKYSVAI
jgi:cytoskeletal protein CcmA (bactofilin family)